MKNPIATLGILLVGLNACSQGQKQNDSNDVKPSVMRTTMHVEPEDTTPSKSIGSVDNGRLENGKCMPFVGSNFQYFDSNSYQHNRAYVHHKLKRTLMESYQVMEEVFPERTFVLMECSNKNGGKMPPHRTHQNGLSVDLMMPLTKNGNIYAGLDSIGSIHYLLSFDKSGKYSNDSNIQIDFPVVSKHILELEKSARNNGLKIAKVIINTDLKDELYSSESGQKLKESGIYVVQRLTPLLNSLHDDHYHVDFELLE